LPFASHSSMEMLLQCLATPAILYRETRRWLMLVLTDFPIVNIGQIIRIIFSIVFGEAPMLVSLVFYFRNHESSRSIRIQSP
jgi:hypothetical protein